MSIVIFNIPGILMAIAAFGAAFALRLRWPAMSDNALLAIGASLCIALDIFWRAGKGKRKWFRPSNGGNFFFLPLWVLGVVWLGMSAYQTHVGPIPALTHAATPTTSSQTHSAHKTAK
jgi:hypothetical protein